MEKNDAVVGEADGQTQLKSPGEVPPQPEARPPVPSRWQIMLAGVALLSAFVMLTMRRLAAERWRKKQS